MTIKIIEPHSIILTPKSEVQDMPRRIELAGRTCYKSEDKITEESSDKFCRNIIKRGHESVLEHCSITVKIVCDRACSHQLVRHRLAAYSQESQRYCDYSSKKHGSSGLEVVCPPSITRYDVDMNKWLSAVEGAYRTYLWLRGEEIAAEDARSVLPNATKTEVVTTLNIRQWRHVFSSAPTGRAFNKHAQWQIKGLMQGVWCELVKAAPSLFNDLECSFKMDPFSCHWLEDTFGNEADRG